MNKDEVYQIAKWISIGILLGYFGQYALNWVKTWKADKSPENNQQTPKQN